MQNELEERIVNFGKNHEPQTSKGGAGYIPRIKKGENMASQDGMLLPAKEANPTILVGNCVGIFMISFLSIGPFRYGVEQLTATAGIFGQKGWILMIVFFLIACYPALATLMFGQSAIKFVAMLTGPGFFAT